MTVEIDRLHELTPTVYIVQVVGGNAVCWASDMLIDENEVVLGIDHSDGDTRLVHPSSVSELETALEAPERSRFLSLVENEVGTICEVDCSTCGDSIKENEEVILLSGVFCGSIDPWIHIDCQHKFIESLVESIGDYNPEIVSGSI